MSKNKQAVVDNSKALDKLLIDIFDKRIEQVEKHTGHEVTFEEAIKIFETPIVGESKRGSK